MPDYTIKQFISGIFRFLAFHKRFDVTTCQRYFNCVWCHMKEQYIAVHTHLHKTPRTVQMIIKPELIFSSRSASPFTISGFMFLVLLPTAIILALL